MGATPQPEVLAQIGRTVHIKGEISGNEDIYIDGEVEGSIQLAGSSLSVGPNGRVQANIAAKNVTVAGSLTGNIQASERTELRRTAVVNGDVETRRIAIEDGAFFRGKLDIRREAKGQPGSPMPISASSTSASNTKPGWPEASR
jgi:cytoskeletal protein CcmA (bactofilin family)